jgi:hypothetical protein
MVAIRGTVKGEKGTGEFSTAVCGIFATISSFFAEATMRDEFSFFPVAWGQHAGGPHDRFNISSDSAVDVWRSWRS